MKSAKKKQEMYFWIALALVVGGVVALAVLPQLANQPPVATLPGGEKITDWSWSGPYADGGVLEKQVNEEIADLKGKLGKTGYPEYETLVGIASQYQLLGDGARAYQNLAKAIEKDPAKGLAYLNMGHLLDQLGAYQSAKGYYDKALAAEPANEAYQALRASFLSERFPGQR